MTDGSGAAGLAALSVCELLLLSLTDNNDHRRGRGQGDPRRRGRGPPRGGAAGRRRRRRPRGGRRAARGDHPDGNAVRRVRPEPGDRWGRSRPESDLTRASPPAFRDIPPRAHCASQHQGHLSYRGAASAPRHQQPKGHRHGADRQDRGREGSHHHRQRQVPRPTTSPSCASARLTRPPRSRATRPSGLRTRRVTAPRPSSGRPVRHVRRSAS